MSEFNIERFVREPQALSRTSLSSEAVRGLRASAPVSSMPVFVDVGSRKIDSQVERDGVPIAPLQINPDVLKDIVLQRPPLLVKVVSQSVPPGTPVPVGTTVDLVMAPPFQLPVGVVSGVHVGIRELNIGDAYQRLNVQDPRVSRLVARAASNQLDAADRAEVNEIFEAADIEGIEITDEPGRDVNAAVETLKVLKTFGG